MAKHQERSWRFGTDRVHITVAWGQQAHPTDVFTDYGLCIAVGRVRVPLIVRLLSQGWEVANG